MPDECARRFDPLGWHRAVLSLECTLAALERLVLLALVKHANGAGQARPGLGTLANETGVSRRKVVMALHELERRGVLQRERQTRGEGYGSTRYQLPLAPPGRALDALPGRPVPSAPGALPAAVPSASHAPPVVHPMHSGSAPHAPELLRELPNGTTGGSSKPSKRSPTKGSQRRETELPSDWRPTEAHRSFAAEHGLDVELEALAFRGHFEGRSALSWNGRFTTWLANQAKWNRAKGREPKARKFGVQRGVADEAEAESWGRSGAQALLGGIS